MPSTLDWRGKAGIVLGRIPWNASARAGDAGIHCHASAMLMVGSPWPETESVVGGGSCSLSVCSFVAAGSMEPWRSCRGGSESVLRRERAQALSQLACELARWQPLSDAFQVGTTVAREDLAFLLEQFDVRACSAVVGPALLTPDEDAS